MKRRIASLAVGLTMGLSLIGGVSATSDNQATPGTRGEANCNGQSTAFLAQGGESDAQGLGNVGRERGLTVKQINGFIDVFCNP